MKNSLCNKITNNIIFFNKLTNKKRYNSSFNDFQNSTIPQFFKIPYTKDSYLMTLKIYIQ